MTTQSTVCACSTCVGAPCTCGCQRPAHVTTASCQRGDVFTCGDTCTCNNCQHANARVPERQ